jgi:pantoate--beta-alanine ligase
LKTLKKIKQVQLLTDKLRRAGKTIGFVPTMGFLHEGHLDLMRAAKKKSDVLVVSIFVNPLQFGPKEDYSRYPRDIKRDEKLCRSVGVDYIFYPDTDELYPEGYSTYVNVENITSTLEGAIRPGHFRGVATIVLKLFNIVQPHLSVFGQKDAQQAAVIKKMAAELNLNHRIIIAPTTRDSDGLAMSSRNIYLTKAQRADAPYLYKALEFAKRKLEDKNYNRDISFIKHQMQKLVTSRKSATKIDYISFNDNRTLEEIKSLKNTALGGEILVSLAVRFGKVRLIDNIVIKR